MVLGRRDQHLGRAPRSFLGEVGLQLTVARATRRKALYLVRDLHGQVQLSVSRIGQGHGRDLLHFLVADGGLDLARQTAAPRRVQLAQARTELQGPVQLAGHPRPLHLGGEAGRFFGGRRPRAHLPLAGEQAGRRLAHEGLESVPHLLHVLVALGGILRHRLQDHPRQPGVVRLGEGGGVGRDFVVGDLRHHAGERFRLEGLSIGEQLVRDGAHREDVRPKVHRLSLDLLGRHVMRGARDVAGARDGRRLEERDTEIHDLHLALRAHPDVARLDVAVDDAVAVSVGEALADLPENVYLPFHRERPLLLDDPLQVEPLDELHRDVGLALLLPHVVHGHDVAVLQAAGGLGLAHEAGLQFGAVGLAGRHGLQGHHALEDGIERLVDGARASPADDLPDLILADALHVSRSHCTLVLSSPGG